MYPVRFPYVNGHVGNIPVNRGYGVTLSVWRMTWRERLKVLWFGEIRVMVKGDTMPPTLITSDRKFRVEGYTPQAETEHYIHSQQEGIYE